MIKREHFWVCKVYAGEDKGEYLADFGVPSLHTPDLDKAKSYKTRKKARLSIKMGGYNEKPVKVVRTISIEEAE